MLKNLFNNPDFINGKLYVDEVCHHKYPCYHDAIYINSYGIEIKLGKVSGQDVYDAITMGLKCNYINNLDNNNEDDNTIHYKICLHFKYLRRFSKLYYDSS